MSVSFTLLGREFILVDNNSSILNEPSSILRRINFSIDDAVKEVERHVASGRVFEKFTETIIIVIYTILIISGLISNLIVSGIIIKNIKNFSARYLYVINLNISDLILCSFCMPFSLVALIRKRWVFGLVLCKLVPFVQGSTVFLSSATVSAIAIDRQKNVLSMFPTKRRKQNKEVIGTILTVWTISLVLSCPVPYAQTIKNVGLQNFYTYEKCVEKWPWDTAKGAYTVIILVVQFLIPALVLITTHLKIESHLNFAMNRSNKSTRPSEARVEIERHRHRRATSILMIASAVFGITWLPWNIFSLIADFYPECMSAEHLYLGFVICHIIAMTSTTTNPILYGWLNSDIRKEILVVKEKISSVIGLRKRRKRVQYQDTLLKLCNTKL